MFLDQTKEKKSYKVLSVIYGREVKLKLTSMGIYPNVIIKIIKNDNSGPLILGVRSSRISLGRGLGKQIEVVEE